MQVHVTKGTVKVNKVRLTSDLKYIKVLQIESPTKNFEYWHTLQYVEDGKEHVGVVFICNAETTNYDDSAQDLTSITITGLDEPDAWDVVVGTVRGQITQVMFYRDPPPKRRNVKVVYHRP